MSGKVKIWMPLLIGDYLADTQHLTTCEHGAYLLIIMHQWRQGHMRSDDLPQIARMSTDAWSIARARLMHMLKVDSDGLFYSPKCDRLKEESVGKQARAHEKAQKAAKARWDRVRAKQGKTDAPSNAHAMPVTFTGSTPPPSASLQVVVVPGAAGAAPPPPPGNARNIGSSGDRADAPSIPAASSGHRSAGGSHPRKSKDRAKQSVSARKRPLSASFGARATARGKTVSGRRVEPQQDTLQTLVLGDATGIAGETQDGRYESFRNLLMKFYAEVNGERLESCAWGINSAKSLRSLLQRCPDLTVDDLTACLGHRVDAIRICMEHPPRKGLVSARDTISNVVDQILYFKHGPSDAFGRRIA